MKPKFDAKVKRPHGRWVPSTDTDITKGWQRARDKMEADRKEREAKVQQIRKIGTRT